MKGRILGVDYGKSRIGLAATDELQIIVSGLETIPNESFRSWIQDYCTREKVCKIVFGEPMHKDGRHTYLWDEIQNEVEFLQKNIPEVKINFQDESFTSSEAIDILFLAGKKKKRRDKKTIDKISAILILQKYLGHI